MDIFRHNSHNAYAVTKKLVFIKNKNNKIQFWHRGFINWRFKIYPHKQFKYFHWLIRNPLLYWERNNGGFKLGLPNFYLWAIK